MTVACSVMVAPSSRHSLKGFSLPSFLMSLLLISAWRATSAAAPPSPSAAGTLLAYLMRIGSGLESAEDATDKRVRAETVGAVVLVLALAGGKDAGDVGHLVEVDPQAAHGVVHAGEDLHRLLARIDADELLVDLENAVELAVQRGAVDVREVEVDHGLAVEAEAELVDDLVNGARGHVARDQVAVLGIPLLEEVEALGLGDLP